MIGSGVAARGLHGAKVCVIPYPENNYRPLALRRVTLTFVAALLVFTKVFALGVVALTPVPAELSTITNARILELTNAERVAAGLPALTVNNQLVQAAQEKANDMLANDYFAHVSPSGVTPWFWINKAAYQYQVAGENLAIDFVEAEDVVAAWMASPSHRDNVLQSDYTETGIAAVTGEYQGHTSTVVVHMFGLPLGTSAPTPTESVAPVPPGPPQVLADDEEIEEEEVVVVSEELLPPVVEETIVNTPAPTPVVEEPDPVPEVIDKELAVILSPAIDRPGTALALSEGSLTPLSEVSASLMPAFYTDLDVTYLEPPARFSQVARQVALLAGFIVLLLLVTAIVVRLNVQHPRMIVHASVVLLLAFGLWIA